MKRISSIFKVLIVLILVLSFTCDHKFRNPLDPDTEIKPDEWAPTNLRATAIDDQTVRLTWTNNCLFESGFRIERKTGSGSFVQIAEVNANSTDYEETGLTYGETYTYRVRAFTQLNQSDYSNEKSVTTTFPAPSNLNAVAIDDQSIRLTWTDNCSFESGFRVERKENDGSFEQIAELNENITVYNDTGLLEDILYTYRVCAFTANHVSGYSNTVVWRTNIIADIDGNVYQTVKIGNQLWMAENLKVTHYRNGDAIPNVTDNTTWSNLTTGAYCNYGNILNNASTYGRFYNWYAVSDSRNIAPNGWHVPTDAEWQSLVDYLGGDAVAGGKMKETGTSHWNSPNTRATNESGFSALPGGYRYTNGYCYHMGSSAYFWSSTEYGSGNAWGRGLDYGSSEVGRYSGNKPWGFSVRCIRD
ncbi:MAG: FISUMP domain-containing protein [bacterium]